MAEDISFRCSRLMGSNFCDEFFRVSLPYVAKKRQKTGQK